MKSLRFPAVALLLLAAAAVLHLRAAVDQVPASVPLDLLPHTLAGWTATDIPLDAAVLQVLGDGRFLNRVYNEPGTAAQPGMPAGPVGLFIGYFPTQRTGQAIHSPQNCLPGAGWTFESSHPLVLTANDGKPYDVGEYVITNGTIRQEVLYWYRSHGRNISSDYRAKLYMMADAIRSNRTDGALIRVITPIQPGEAVIDSHNRAVRFAATLTPLLPPYIPD